MSKPCSGSGFVPIPLTSLLPQGPSSEWGGLAVTVPFPVPSPPQSVTPAGDVSELGGDGCRTLLERW